MSASIGEMGFSAAAVLSFAAYWWGYVGREGGTWRGSVLKTAAVASLGLVALLQSAPDGVQGFGAIVLGLFCGALGDFALSRPGKAAFLAGMAAFSFGHVAYAFGFWHRSAQLTGAAVALSPTAPQFAALCALGLVLLSTEWWLAPHTGPLRWPVRGYVAVIGCMAATAILMADHPGAGVIQLGVGLFVLSDLLLALRLFVVTNAARQRQLSHTLWPAYWLGQALILAGALSFWISPFKFP